MDILTEGLIWINPAKFLDVMWEKGTRHYNTDVNRNNIRYIPCVNFSAPGIILEPVRTEEEIAGDLRCTVATMRVLQTGNAIPYDLPPLHFWEGTDTLIIVTYWGKQGGWAAKTYTWFRTIRYAPAIIVYL